jgi:hypothetical protein
MKANVVYLKINLLSKQAITGAGVLYEFDELKHIKSKPNFSVAEFRLRDGKDLEIYFVDLDLQNV